MYSKDVTVVSANDLGMHCADLDFQIFSLLPPFDVIHAQFTQKGTPSSSPVILDDIQVEVTYTAISHSDDPAGIDSISSTSQNLPGVFKGNFWNDSGLALPPGLINDNFAEL